MGLASAQQEAAAESAGYASKEASAEASAKALSEASQKLALLETAEDEAKSRFSTSLKHEEEALMRSEEVARNAKLAQNEAEEALAQERVKSIKAIGHSREEAA